MQSQLATIDASHHKNHKKSKNQYQNYEDELENYGNKSRLGLGEWDSLESIRIPKVNTKSHPSNQLKPYRNQQQSDDSDSTSVFKYGQNQHQINYQDIKVQQLEKQIQDLRFSIQYLNVKLNNMLNKYEICKVYQFKSATAIQNDPQKQSQILSKQIDNNKKVIDHQQNQLHKIRQLAKDYEERDHLIQLQMNIVQLEEELANKKKNNIFFGVEVQKKDNMLINLAQQKTYDELNAIKTIKYQMMHQFKKYHENKIKLEELDKTLTSISNKDDDISIKLAKYKTIAQNKSLDVKVNQPFLIIKKQYQQMNLVLQENKKKIQVLKKSHKLNIQKIQWQIQIMNKQTDVINKKIKNLDQINNQKAQKISQIIDKNHIQIKALQNISYKFLEDWSKEENQRYKPQKSLKNILKPNLRMKSSRPHYNNPQISSNYSKDQEALNQDKFDQRKLINQKKPFNIIKNKSSIQQSNQLTVINDKNNIQTIENKMTTKPYLKFKKDQYITIDRDINKSPVISTDKNKQSSVTKPIKIIKLLKSKEQKTKR